MKKNDKIISNDEILEKANRISITIQIKIEEFCGEFKNIYEKIFSSYPDANILENTGYIYKNYSSQFKKILKLIEKFYEYKTIIDFISEVEQCKKICWTANVYSHIQMYMESWRVEVDEMLHNIFLHNMNDNIY